MAIESVVGRLRYEVRPRPEYDCNVSPELFAGMKVLVLVSDLRAVLDALEEAEGCLAIVHEAWHAQGTPCTRSTCATLSRLRALGVGEAGGGK
jgi:hypothetical protein